MKNNYIINNNGIVNTGQVGGSVTNILSNSVDWKGLTENLEHYLIECEDKELRKAASEMLKEARTQDLNQAKQSAKKFGEKGLSIAKQLGLNILSGFIVYALTQ